MPEQPSPKIRHTPMGTVACRVAPRLAYAELHARTSFSFLVGASHPDELVARAAELGYRALAVTDEASPVGPDDPARLSAVRALGARLGVPLVAANDVHAHVPERRRLLAVLACIREGTTLGEAGRLLFANGERHLRPLDEVARLFSDVPEA